MVTTLPNSTWNNKREVQTGNIGEELVYRFFEEHGYVIYNPRTDGPHAADADVYKNKKFMFHLEIKTKPKCYKYPETGFDYRLYKVYKELGSRVFVAFVDWSTKSVYGNFLDILNKEHEYCGYQYPKKQTKKGGEGLLIYFPMDVMKTLFRLDDDAAKKLKELSSNKYQQFYK